MAMDGTGDLHDESVVFVVFVIFKAEERVVVQVSFVACLSDGQFSVHPMLRENIYSFSIGVV